MPPLFADRLAKAVQDKGSPLVVGLDPDLKRFPAQVLAAAREKTQDSRRQAAAAIVTFNESDFPPESVDPFEIDVLHPDAFLLDLLDLSPRLVIDELERQSTANRREPRTIAALLDTVARAGTPGFADEVRRLLA